MADVCFNQLRYVDEIWFAHRLWPSEGSDIDKCETGNSIASILTSYRFIKMAAARPLNTIIQRGHSFNFNVLLDERRDGTDWVLRVKAALVIDDGKFRPFVISRHNFLLMTSTRPPFDTTRRNSSYRSSVCLAMIGIRFTGVPAQTHHLHHSFSHRVHHVSFLLNFLIVSCCHLNYLHMIWNSG